MTFIVKKNNAGRIHICKWIYYNIFRKGSWIFYDEEEIKTNFDLKSTFMSKSRLNETKWRVYLVNLSFSCRQYPEPLHIGTAHFLCGYGYQMSKNQVANYFIAKTKNK